MIRILSIASIIAVVLVLPAMAEDATVKAPTTTTDMTPGARSNLFTEEQARAHLAKLGYVNISPLTKDSNGAWRGTAMKDGKEIGVAVDIKGDVTNK